MNRKFINVQPSELKFPFQLNKLSTCWLELSSKTDINVAFKVKTTHPKKYCVRPNSGLISPGSSCVVKVSMQAQKEYPAPLPKDKFLVLSMVAPVGMNADDITSEMFRKEKGYDVEELKLRVVFVTAEPPSPIAEVSEEDLSPEAHELQKSERNNYIMDLFDAATTSIGESEDQFFKESNADREDEEELFLAAESSFESERKLSQDWDRVSKLIEERSFIKLENQELQYEADMIRKRIYRSSSNHGVIVFVVLACFLGIVFGYVIR